MTSTEHFDVLIIGAGISGIGAAYHLLDQQPTTSFVVLESKDTFGGTWVTHKYPGIRSDSDLYTFGYRFKPWIGAPMTGMRPLASEMTMYAGMLCRRASRITRSNSSMQLSGVITAEAQQAAAEIGWNRS